MDRCKIKYAVIILNYNTADDAIVAASSIIDSALDNDFIICIVDGCSSKKNQKEILQTANLSRTHLLFLDINGGYARGNNEGVRFLSTLYDFQYTIIMNPDVILSTKGTIDRLLQKLSEMDSDYCGIQPLIWTPHFNNDASMQTCIRKVYSYFDCILDSFYPIRKLFSRKYKEIVYFEERPYKDYIPFEVPSGCFFIIKTEIFNKVGMFDERTFLYAEEIILGYKLKQLNYKFILNPFFKVIHEGGKSTGAHRKKVTSFSAKEEIKALSVYMKYYLRCNLLEIYVVRFLFMINFYIKKC